jgi:hypothetical membrane protein
MRLLTLAGVAGPVVFLCAVIVSAFLRPDYSHLASFISELGASGSSVASLMNYAGFIGAGLLFAAFGVALALRLPRTPLVWIGSALVSAFGVGVIASGVFSCDVGCPHTGGSLHNAIHNRIGPIAFVCLIAAAGIFGMAFRQLGQWRHLATYSLLTSAGAAVLMVALVRSLDTRLLTGLWQRLLLATLYLWCAVVAIAVYRGQKLVRAPSNVELMPSPRAPSS